MNLVFKYKFINRPKLKKQKCSTEEFFHNNINDHLHVNQQIDMIGDKAHMNCTLM